ncbi:MAG: translation initiation factor IF-2 [Nitrospirae bacterium]|nr:translation initiation factor IF-2 [Nitrospirota bacterium]
MTVSVVELARELGKTSKELIALLKAKGIAVENHMSLLTAEQVAAVKPGASPASKTITKKKTMTTRSAASEAASPRAVTVKKAATAKAAAPKTAPAKETTAKAGTKPATRPSPAPGQAAAPSASAGESAGSLQRRTTVLIKRKRATEEPSVELIEPVAAGHPPTQVEPHPHEPAPLIEPTVVARGPGAPVVTEAAPAPPIHPASPAPASATTGTKPAAPPAAKPDGGDAAKPKRFKVMKEEMFDFRREVKKLHDFKPFQHRAPRVGSRKMMKRAPGADTPDASKPRRKIIKLYPGVTIKEFAELIGQKGGLIISRLMEMGIMATINQPIDLDAALLIAESFELKAEITSQPTEEELLGVANQPEPVAESLQTRPPVVTIMGHVDHGKTSLLDAIRSTKVAASEAGGITQHIGAYTVDIRDRKVTFLDTPGHEAFTAMRARGAKVTDLVVLVVAADDGVMPQTLEAVNHARAAEVPILVAINKIDKPEAQPERIKRELADQGLIPEQWGGHTIYVEVSAKKKTGLDTLLEMILLQSEVLELRARPSSPAKGIIIEAKLDRGRGPVATVLVQDGTLRIGDIFVAGVQAGRIRALIDHTGKRVEEAGPSMAVEVIGLDGVPQAGDQLLVVTDERAAREVALARMQRQRSVELSSYQKVTLEDLHTRIKEGMVKELNLVIKADVQGSVEALSTSLERLNAAAVKIRIIHSGAGGITESDVLLASSSNALILGFHVRPDAKVQALAEREKVTIRLYEIIYEVIADVRAAMEGLLEPTFKERVVGRADVRQLFTLPKAGVIAGTYVTEGTISRSGTGIRVVRDHVPVYEGKIGSLRRFKDDVREVQSGYECGIGIENFNDLKVGDVLEVFVQDKVAAKLEG